MGEKYPLNRKYTFKNSETKEEIFTINGCVYKIIGSIVYIQKERYIQCFYKGEPPKEKYWEVTVLSPNWVRKLDKLWKKTQEKALNEFMDIVSKTKTPKNKY